MIHNLVNWKSVLCKSRIGDDVALSLPNIVDIANKRTLLSKILSMKRQNPIDFASAIRMLSEKRTEAFNSGKFGSAPDHFSWYNLNFVDWISSLGYHIELTGDEFEAYINSDKLI